MVNKYIPKIGDIVYFNDKPALVVSNNIFNLLTAMVIVCPITTNIKDFPTHYILNNTKK